MEIKDKKLHRVVSTAIIHKDGKYLIVLRSPKKKAFPNRWTLPGGGLETDDYIGKPKTTIDAWYYVVEDSLRREVKEETNLEVDNITYLLSLSFIRTDGIPVCCLSYFCDYKSGEVKLDDENIDYKWVDLEEANNYDLVEGILEEIQMADKIIKKNKNI